LQVKNTVENIICFGDATQKNAVEKKSKGHLIQRIGNFWSHFAGKNSLSWEIVVDQSQKKKARNNKEILKSAKLYGKMRENADHSSEPRKICGQCATGTFAKAKIEGLGQLSATCAEVGLGTVARFSENKIYSLNTHIHTSHAGFAIILFAIIHIWCN